MIVKMNIGGVWVAFGEPLAPNKPEPFYPYLLEVNTIADTTGEATGSTNFKLMLLAKPLVHLNVRRQVQVLSDDLTLRFEGVVRSLAYTNEIDVGVEA